MDMEEELKSIERRYCALKDLAKTKDTFVECQRCLDEAERLLPRRLELLQKLGLLPSEQVNHNHY